MQVSRAVWLVHGAHLLAEDAVVPRGGQSTEGVVRRRGKGNTEQRRTQLHHRGAHNQAAQQVRSGLQRGFAGFLQGKQKDRLSGHDWTTVQLHESRSGGLRAAVLRQGVRHEDHQGKGQLSVQVQVVLRGHLQHLPH